MRHIVCLTFALFSFVSHSQFLGKGNCLGAGIVAITSDNLKQFPNVKFGLIIVLIEKESPLAKSDIPVGSVITFINHIKVSDKKAYVQALDTLNEGDLVTVNYVLDGVNREEKVIVGHLGSHGDCVILDTKKNLY